MTDALIGDADGVYHLLRRPGSDTEAARAYRAAIAGGGNEAERAFPSGALESLRQRALISSGRACSSKDVRAGCGDR